MNSNPQSDSRESVFLLKPSFQSLFSFMKYQEQTLATGPGFVVNSRNGPLLITNRHNLSGCRCETNESISPTGGIPDRVAIVHNHVSDLGNWICREEFLLNGDTPRWFEHPTLGNAVDVVALPLTNLQDVRLIPHDIDADQSPLTIGPADAISVVGFPFGKTAGARTAIWATGFIATEPESDYEDLPAFLIDCRSRQGQSGSPVIAQRPPGTMTVDKEGNARYWTTPTTKLLGIYSGRINEQSDLGIVWKLTTIRELVRSAESLA